MPKKMDICRYGQQIDEIYDLSYGLEMSWYEFLDENPELEPGKAMDSWILENADWIEDSLREVALRDEKLELTGSIVQNGRTCI